MGREDQDNCKSMPSGFLTGSAMVRSPWIGWITSHQSTCPEAVLGKLLGRRQEVARCAVHQDVQPRVLRSHLLDPPEGTTTEGRIRKSWESGTPPLRTDLVGPS